MIQATFEINRLTHFNLSKLIFVINEFNHVSRPSEFQGLSPILHYLGQYQHKESTIFWFLDLNNLIRIRSQLLTKSLLIFSYQVTKSIHFT